MRSEVHQSSTLEYLTIYPDGYQAGTTYPLLIWLHGFGADMHDLAFLAHAAHRTGYIHVLPNAPLGGFDGPEGTVRAGSSAAARKVPSPSDWRWQRWTAAFKKCWRSFTSWRVRRCWWVSRRAAISPCATVCPGPRCSPDWRL